MDPEELAAIEGEPTEEELLQLEELLGHPVGRGDYVALNSLFSTL